MKKTCEKIGFSSKEGADIELKRILDTQQRPWANRDIKACRSYVCPYCSKLDSKIWHLTSKPKIIIYEY